MRRIILVILVILFVVSLIFNGYLWQENSRKDTLVEYDTAFHAALKRYPLLSPRILRDTHPDFILNFLDLRTNLHKKLDSLGDKFSMYFEYLPTGNSIGINANNEFYAASLFKLPVVMAYFRRKELTNTKEDVKVKLTKEMLDSRFGDLWQKGEGYEIGLDEAVQLALEKSDNTAAEALGAAITQDAFNDVYEAIDIPLQITNNGAVMTAKNYSSILKALYFSAVLTKEDSSKTLDYLTHSEFNDKLIAGLPKDITVAHKIGVIDEKSYMDCGIVYIPSRPYILCMVSSGTEDDARSRMSSTSKMIYDFVSNAKSLNIDN